MKLRTLLLPVALVLSGCATVPKNAAATDTTPRRVRDSAPDRIAAQQAGAPHSLQLESQSERWGFDAARERRRQEEAEKRQAKNPPPAAGGKSVDVTAP